MTGADGFVGRHLVRTLLQSDHRIVAACRLAIEVPAEWARPMEAAKLRMVPFELDSAELVRTALEDQPDAIVHLAAVAYSQDAKAGPDHTWRINANGTAGLLAAVARARDSGGSDPLVVVVSSAEVYGEGESRPRMQSDPARPQGVVQREQARGGSRGGSGDFGWGLRVIVDSPLSIDRPGADQSAGAELARRASCRETRRGRERLHRAGLHGRAGRCGRLCCASWREAVPERPTTLLAGGEVRVR